MLQSNTSDLPDGLKLAPNVWVGNPDIMPQRYEPKLMAYGQQELHFTDEPNGDTVFHDVTLIAEGIWTDSHSKRATRYTAAALEKMTIQKSTVKMNHDIYGTLPITNEIGAVENPKFISNTPARWVGDVRIFPTQNGKDTTLLLKRGALRDISSEMFVYEEKTDKKNVMDATDIIFMGAATVRTGACSLCKFNESTKEAPKLTDNTQKEPASKTPEVDEEIKTLQAQIAEAEAAKEKNLAHQLETALAKNKELEDLLSAKELELEEVKHTAEKERLQSQLNELRREPVYKTHSTPATRTAMKQPTEVDDKYYEVPTSMFGA